MKSGTFIPLLVVVLLPSCGGTVSQTSQKPAILGSSTSSVREEFDPQTLDDDFLLQ
jgi:hypothetical protein